MFPHQQGFFPFAELQFSRGELLFKYLLSQCRGRENFSTRSGDQPIASVLIMSSYVVLYFLKIIEKEMAK